MSLCNHVAITLFLKEQMPIVTDRNDGILLDIGCGEQPYRNIYTDWFKMVVAADFDVRSRIDARIDVHALPVRDESCHVVSLTEVIEHLAEAQVALKEICRVLKRDGYLLLTWPFIYPLHEIPRDYARYTEFAMQHILESSGLRLERLYRRGDLVSVAFGILEQFAFGVLELFSRIPLIGHPLFHPLKQVLQAFLIGAWSLYFKAVWSKQRFRPARAGSNLKGPVNSLALWTMGYCARVRKIKGSSA